MTIFVYLGMIHIAGFDIFEIIGDNFNKQEKECQYGDFDFAGYIPRIGRGNEIY